MKQWDPGLLGEAAVKWKLKPLGEMLREMTEKEEDRFIEGIVQGAAVKLEEGASTEEMVEWSMGKLEEWKRRKQ